MPVSVRMHFCITDLELCYGSSKIHHAPCCCTSWPVKLVQLIPIQDEVSVRQKRTRQRGSATVIEDLYQIMFPTQLHILAAVPGFTWIMKLIIYIINSLLVACSLYGAWLPFFPALDEHALSTSQVPLLLKVLRVCGEAEGRYWHLPPRVTK